MPETAAGPDQAVPAEPTVLRAMNCARDGAGPEDTPLDVLAARLCAGAVAISASTAAWLVLVAEFDRREGWAVPGVGSCAHWLSWQCGISPGTARDHVRLARALTGLPRVTEELGAGRLSHAKARAIARVADPDTEPALLDLAAHCTAAQLERVVAGWRRADTAATDAAATQAAEAQRRARADALAEGRSEEDSHSAGQLAAAAVWAAWWPDGADPQRTGPRWEHRFDWRDEGDGSVTLRLRLSVEEAAEVVAEVEQRAEVLTRRERVARSSAETDADLPTGPTNAGRAREIASARRAQVTVARTTAFLDLLRAGAASVDRVPGDPARREVLVRVDAAVLADDLAAGQAALDGVAALSPAQARRLACDAAVTAVLVEDGQVIACGRTRRFATRAQRRALLTRDSGCARPGCTETRPERLHAHHLVSWMHGGRTDVDNLVLLCYRCHGLVHDLELTVTRHQGRLQAHATDGTRVWTGPPGPGDAAESGEPDPVPELPPFWPANGARMDLRHVVGVVLDHRTALRRRRRTEAPAPGSAAAA